MFRTTTAPVPITAWRPIEIRSEMLAPTPTAEHSPISTSPPAKTPGAMLVKSCSVQSWSIELPVFRMQNVSDSRPGPYMRTSENNGAFANLRRRRNDRRRMLD